MHRDEFACCLISDSLQSPSWRCVVFVMLTKAYCALSEHGSDQALSDRACCTTFLSRPLSVLGWTTAMLFWLDFHRAQSNLYKWFRMQRLVFNEPKRAHVTPLFISLHWLPVAASSRHWCLHIEQPQAQHPPTSSHYYESTSPPEVWDLLVSDASWYHHREAQNHSPEHSCSTIPGRWNDLPTLSGMLDHCQSSNNKWKFISFDTT